MDKLTELNQLLKGFVHARGKRYGMVHTCGCEISDLGMKLCPTHYQQYKDFTHLTYVSPSSCNIENFMGIKVIKPTSKELSEKNLEKKTGL